MRLKHFTELDGVRAIAALMVMFFHFFNAIETKSSILLLIKKFAFIGQTGVSLFFVLSGFLITRILINSKNSEHFFKNFYIRRALRIFPLYYLFLIIFYFVLPLLDNSGVAPFGLQIYFWVYLQNIAITFGWNSIGPQHFWSLAVEEHFYFIWPLLIYYLNNKNIKIAIYLTILIAFIVRVIMVTNHTEVFYFTFSRMDELAVGALLAVWELKGKLQESESKKFIWRFVMILVPTGLLWYFTTGLKIDLIQMVKFVLLAFCYFCFIGFAITCKANHWLKKALQQPFLLYSGRISYGLYVYHPLCFLLAEKYFNSNSIIINLITSFAFCYLIASMSYYLFEARFLSFKKKFSYN